MGAGYAVVVVVIEGWNIELGEEYIDALVVKEESPSVAADELDWRLVAEVGRFEDVVEADWAGVIDLVVIVVERGDAEEDEVVEEVSICAVGTTLIADTRQPAGASPLKTTWTIDPNTQKRA